MSNQQAAAHLALIAYAFANIFLLLGMLGSIQSDAERGTKIWAFFGFATVLFALNSWAISTF